MEIVVNGVERVVAWGAVLGSVVKGAGRVELWRGGRLMVGDLKAALMPGDRVKWE